MSSKKSIRICTIPYLVIKNRIQDAKYHSKKEFRDTLDNHGGPGSYFFPSIDSYTYNDLKWRNYVLVFRAIW